MSKYLRVLMRMVFCFFCAALYLTASPEPLRAQGSVSVSDKEAEKDVGALETSSSAGDSVRYARHSVFASAKTYGAETKLGARARIALTVARLKHRIGDNQLGVAQAKALLEEVVQANPWDARYSLDAVLLLANMCRTVDHNTIACDDIAKKLVHIKNSMPAHNSFAAHARYELTCMRMDGIIDHSTMSLVDALDAVLESMPFFAECSTFGIDMRILVVALRMNDLVDATILDRITINQFLDELENCPLDHDKDQWVKNMRTDIR